VTPKQLQAGLDRAGLSQRGAARELGINERHMRRYVAGDAVIPKHIQIAVRCICEHRASDSGDASNGK
jgi:hypothetical protein